MTSFAPFLSGSGTIATILATMALVSAVEVLVPLHARGGWHRRHLGPNLALTLLTFATNLLLSIGLVPLVLALEAHDVGLLHALALPPVAAAAVAIAAFDLSFYAAHRSWHRVPALWRFHAVHHADPEVDVTTTIRQHPGETLLRAAVMAVTAAVVGPSLVAFAVYRSASAVNGLLEHANVRAPGWLDGPLSLVTTWPHMHKVHHSRTATQTDTNYGNLLSVWDRLFGSFTPSSAGTAITYGLDGYDRADRQTTRALLAMPFTRAATDDAPTRPRRVASTGSAA